MKVYLVGGAVRDELLGLTPKERDWVVVGGSPIELLNAGYENVGKSFPVFLHPETKEEYALARIERKVGLGYHGFDFDTSKTVTLEEDLKRRDLTINAMAKTSEGEIIDPYGGKRDLKNRVLRHVSEAFVEDPVRVLRVARFAARFAPLGFTVAPQTLALMKEMGQKGELDALVPERIFKEIELAFKTQSPVTFIQVLRQCDALKKILPEIDALYGVEQAVEHHPEIDTGIHTELVLAQATKLSEDPVIRFAAMCHDVGKALTDKALLPDHQGHEEKGLVLVTKLCERLHVPKEYQQLAELVTKLHGECHGVSKKTPEQILAILERADAFRRPARFEQFLIACDADSKGRPGYEDKEYLPRAILLKAFQSAVSVDVKAVIEEVANKSGEQIQQALHAARVKAIEDQM